MRKVDRLTWLIHAKTSQISSDSYPDLIRIYPATHLFDFHSSTISDNRL